MEKFICIHGHFYQPPRENPWLEAVEVQDSAYPYHDWNERVTAECYAPNSASRILDESNRIRKIVSNYASISFNFGPTLLHWMELNSPSLYRAVQAADRESQGRFSGHGSAIAQAYNHMIMPLASRRDKYTQVIWGIRDFQHRFGRAPEGMWLPETAVDLESLNILAEAGIRYTILSPYQASRVRPPGGRFWVDVSGGRIDPSMAYRVSLRGGRHINVFFYDGPISRAVAFERLLVKGEYLADRLMGAFSNARPWTQLVHIATDGETYGHHHRHGDMGLAYALECLRANGLARLTNYGEFLERHPPTHEVQIFENSSWSCPHGVERWRSHCGCCSGGNGGWRQDWRAPLRSALDWLRDTLVPAYAEHARRFLRDPWEARNDYISVVLDRSQENVDCFLARHARRDLSEQEKIRVLKLLEIQRHAMLMYTSCGWFFDELSGIESVQVIRYAARAIQLAGTLFGNNLENRFLERLEQAPSNCPEFGNGRHIYEKFVRPSMLDLDKVAAHYAVSSLFEKYPNRSSIFCYEVEQEDLRSHQSGKARLVLGRVGITSQITRESGRVTYGILHLGEHNISGGVRAFAGDEAYRQFSKEISEAFERGDFAQVLRGIYQSFDAGTYSLKLLFRDEQRRILRLILESSLAHAEASYRHIYESDAPLMYFVRSLDMPSPRLLRMAAEVVLNTDLERAFASNNLDFERIEALLKEANRIGISFDQQKLEFALRATIERIAAFFANYPTALKLLQKLNLAVTLARSLPFEVDLWTAQNIYYELLRNEYPKMCSSNDPTAITWKGLFEALGKNLMFRLE